MKIRLSCAITFLVYAIGFSKPPYTISKEDIIAQFSVENKSNRIYCNNHQGKKIWLYYNENTHLIVKLKDNKKKKFILQTIRYQNNMIEGLPFHPWGPPHIKINCTLEEIQSLKIVTTQFDHESPYFNLDSCRVLSRFKNDSIAKDYKSIDKLTLLLRTKMKSDHDSISIVEGACYNLTFRDNNRTEYGVVSKITADSIYISSSFNNETALANKKEYKIFRYSFKDLAELKLRKSGGFSYKTIDLNLYQINVVKTTREKLDCPAWFAITPESGKINFYRSWLTERGYLGITEVNGRPTWYEGEIVD